MTAREYFEGVRQDVLRLSKARQACEEIRARMQPHGQQLGSIGHASGVKDAMAPVDALMEMERALGPETARLEAELEVASAVLFGADGRGGLAKARGSLDADILWAYYLDGQSWREVARNFAGDGASPVHWCRQRARRALAYADLVGLAYLIEL